MVLKNLTSFIRLCCCIFHFQSVGCHLERTSNFTQYTRNMCSQHSVFVIPLSGEIFELKAELNNEKKEKRKEAVKKVIAAMTVGKDVRYRRKCKL